MTTPFIAIRDGQFTAEGEEVRAELIEDTVADALKTDDPRGYIAEWSELFRAGMVQLAEDGGQ